MSETSEVTRPLIESIAALPYCTGYRIHAGRVAVRGGWMHCAPRGFPDIGSVIRGRAVFFETKTPEGTLQPWQIECHDQLRRAGAIVVVPRSVMEGLMVVRGILGEERT